MRLPAEVMDIAGATMIALAGTLIVAGLAYGLYGLQEWLLGQGAPLWLAVGIPLSLFMALDVWVYWRTFQIMRRW